MLEITVWINLNDELGADNWKYAIVHTRDGNGDECWLCCANTFKEALAICFAHHLKIIGYYKNGEQVDKKEMEQL